MAEECTTTAANTSVNVAMGLPPTNPPYVVIRQRSRSSERPNVKSSSCSLPFGCCSGREATPETRPFVLQQPLLAVQPAAVAGERAVRPDHAVTGYHQGHGVGAVGEPHGADRGRPADARGEACVTQRLSGRDRAERVPALALEVGARADPRRAVEHADVAI